MRRPFFAVLGGMGTLATESYVRLVNEATHAHGDQEYLDYVVFNDAGVPDRTAFITGDSPDDPFPVIADDIAKASAMGASFIVLTCNTAHYFHERFQALTDVPILHMPRGAVARLASLYPLDAPGGVSHMDDGMDDGTDDGTGARERVRRVGFLGTLGSRVAGVYRRAVEEAGYEFVEPDDALQTRVTSLIYDDVKGSGTLDRGRYGSVLHDLLDPSGVHRADVAILGCTELSVLNEAFPTPHLPVIDAQAVLVEDTVALAKRLRGDA